MERPPRAAGLGALLSEPSRSRVPARAPEPVRPLLPDAFTRLARLEFLAPDERRFLSRVQARTHANLAAFLEGVAGSKRVALAAACGDIEAPVFEILVRLLDEGSRHEARYRRLEALVGEGMPPGYAFAVNPSRGARAFLESSTWAVLALAWHARLCRQANAFFGLVDGEDVDPGFREAFRLDRRDVATGQAMELLPWLRVDGSLDRLAREAAVDEYIGLLRLLDGLLYRQARADTSYGFRHLGREFPPSADARLMRETLAAYREQFILRGAADARFRPLLDSLLAPAQSVRIAAAIASIGAEAAGSA